jgi:hypothetical protein
LKPKFLFLALGVYWLQTGSSLLEAQDGPRFLYDEGHVAILEHDGSLYDRLTPDGIPNFEPRMRVARELIRAHGDHYDFIVIFTDFDFSRAGADGFYTGVRNDTRGIGEAFFDFGSEFGSASRLQGVIDLGPVSHYRREPFSLDPSDPGFQATMSILAHEVGHRWLAQVRYRDDSGKVSDELLGRDGVHWSYLLSSDASFLYGSSWQANSDGSFTAIDVPRRFSALDLYLMGLLGPQEVPPFLLLRNPEIDPNRYPEIGARVIAEPETVCVEQIIDIEGPRVPGVDTSQKEFRLAFVLLTQENVLPSVKDIDSIECVRVGFGPCFSSLTLGRACADTEIVPVTALEVAAAAYNP